MDTKEPEFRCGTGIAKDSLVKKFNLPYESWMQDYPYEVADPEQVDFYLQCYAELTDDDEKFVMMRFLIQAIDGHVGWDFYHYWKKLKEILIKDFLIHEYTVYYWCCFDKHELEECFNIAPFMRELWCMQKYTHREQKLSSAELAEIIAKEIRYLVADEKFEKLQEEIEYAINTRKSLGDY